MSAGGEEIISQQQEDPAVSSTYWGRQEAKWRWQDEEGRALVVREAGRSLTLKKWLNLCLTENKICHEVELQLLQQDMEARGEEEVAVQAAAEIFLPRPRKYEGEVQVSVWPP